MKTSLANILLASFLFSLPGILSAQIIALDEKEHLYEKRSGWLPYLFAADSLGTAVGAAAFTAGTVQPQTSTFGTAFITSNESFLLSGAHNNYQPGNKGRLLIDTFILANHFTDQRFYSGIPQPGQALPGSNDSDSENFTTGISNELTFSIDFKYRLPIGNIRDSPIAIYRLKEGIVESGPTGGKDWNPLINGQTTLGAKFFYTERDLSNFKENQTGITVDNRTLESNTNGIKFWIDHDNTDFPRNPTQGSRQVISLHRDFGFFNSSDSWTNLKASFSKYVDLSKDSWFKQKILAFNFWTSNTLDWKRNPNGTVDHRPPPNYGSELGGFDQLRAYSNGRFHDKAAVNYTAELRLTPTLQPLQEIPLLNYFQIDWWQMAPFIEAGRVAPSYNTDLYSKDLKWNVGVGIRLMSFRNVVRLDIAVGEEGASVWAMFSQPFSRLGQ